MSPTRRDILKLSAGAVSAALAARSVTAAPASIEDAIDQPNVYLEEITLVIVQARLSDGRSVSLASGFGDCQLTVSRMDDDCAMVEEVRMPSRTGEFLEMSASTCLHHDLAKAGLPVSPFSMERHVHRRREFWERKHADAQVAA